MPFKNPFRTLLIICALAAAATGGWFAARILPTKLGSAPASGRRVLFYQSPMHPWIKSDKPGNCTICGMKLVPVYDGESEGSSNLITLSAQSINVLHAESAPVLRAPLRRTLHVERLACAFNAVGRMV